MASLDQVHTDVFLTHFMWDLSVCRCYVLLIFWVFQGKQDAAEYFAKLFAYPPLSRMRTSSPRLEYDQKWQYELDMITQLPRQLLQPGRQHDRAECLYWFVKSKLPNARLLFEQSNANMFMVSALLFLISFTCKEQIPAILPSWTFLTFQFGFYFYKQAWRLKYEIAKIWSRWDDLTAGAQPLW